MNFEAFLTDVLGPILDHPESLKVEVKGSGRKVDVTIFAESRDRGRIIGKSGRMISPSAPCLRRPGRRPGPW